MSLLFHQAGLPESFFLDLQSKVSENLSARIHQNLHYNRSEIEDIRNFDFKLFPEGFIIDKKETKNFRELCVLSQISLARPVAITSHRKIVGNIIVLIKKLVRPIVNSQIKPYIDTISSLNYNYITILAKQAVEIKELKNRLQ